MIKIFGILHLSFLSLRKTIITVKFATIPTDAITVDTIMTMSSIIEDSLRIHRNPRGTYDVIILLDPEIFRKELDMEMIPSISKALDPWT